MLEPNPPDEAVAAPLRILLVDDEPFARLRLRTLVGDLAPLGEVVGEAADAGGALAWLEQASCDCLLLDVQMPGRDGLALATALKAQANPPAVVFVTAHAAHAVTAFELEAVDYLTKPVRRERLEAALRRVARRLRGPPAIPPARADEAATATATRRATDVIVVSERGGIVRVPVAEVLYLKAELKYVTLRTAERSHLLDDALADLEQRLGGRFLRVHRNALVARDAIRALERRAAPAGERDEDGAAGEGWAVRVAPVDEWLVVSRRQVAAVREALSSAGR